MPFQTTYIHRRKRIVIQPDQRVQQEVTRLYAPIRLQCSPRIHFRSIPSRSCYYSACMYFCQITHEYSLCIIIMHTPRHISISLSWQSKLVYIFIITAAATTKTTPNIYVSSPFLFYFSNEKQTKTVSHPGKETGAGRWAAATIRPLCLMLLMRSAILHNRTRAGDNAIIPFAYVWMEGQMYISLFVVIAKFRFNGSEIENLSNNGLMSLESYFPPLSFYGTFYTHKM